MILAVVVIIPGEPRIPWWGGRRARVGRPASGISRQPPEGTSRQDIEPEFCVSKKGLLREVHGDGRSRQAMRNLNPLLGGASAGGAGVGCRPLRTPTSAATGRHPSEGGDSEPMLVPRPSIQTQNSGSVSSTFYLESRPLASLAHQSNPPGLFHPSGSQFSKCPSQRSLAEAPPTEFFHTHFLQRKLLRNRSLAGGPAAFCEKLME